MCKEYAVEISIKVKVPPNMENINGVLVYFSVICGVILNTIVSLLRLIRWYLQWQSSTSQNYEDEYQKIWKMICRMWKTDWRSNSREVTVILMGEKIVHLKWKTTDIKPLNYLHTFQNRKPVALLKKKKLIPLMAGSEAKPRKYHSEVTTQWHWFLLLLFSF